MIPMLLISVQNSAELRLCHELGVMWIDLKDPKAGSLGGPSLECISEVSGIAKALEHGPAHLSLALGELKDLCVHNLSPEIRSYDFAKIGTSGIHEDKIACLASDLIQRLEIPNKLILTHYADHRLANSPKFEPILDCAIGLNCQYLLIDTFSKRSGRLLDWYSLRQLAMIVEKVHAVGMRITLAGSLRMHDLPKIAEIGPDIIAIRGAACHTGQRSNELCRERVSSLVSLARNSFLLDRNLESTNYLCSPNK